MERNSKLSLPVHQIKVRDICSHGPSFFNAYRYHGHAEPCDQSNIHAAPQNEGTSGGVIAVAVLLCVAVLLGGIYVIRRIRWNRAARESAKDPDADENIAPANEARGEII